jgi:hypothetical protein
MFILFQTEMLGQQRLFHSEGVKINKRAWLPDDGI